MKYIIFDMDGVIVDSEYTYLESKTEILKEAGIDLPLSYQYQFMGTTYHYMWDTMKNELGLPNSVDFYIDLMNRKREEIVNRDGIKPIKDIIPFIEKLYNKGFILAVASSSPKQEIIRNLTELKVMNYFKVLVSGEEVENSKPHPDIFLKTASLLGTDAKKCIVIEDTKNGSIAAKSSGAYCIGYQNPSFPPQDLGICDKIISSFFDLTLNDIFEGDKS